MKKITSLLMLFLVCMGTAWGQAIVGFTQASTEKTLPSALTTGYYLIKEVNPNANGKPGGFLRAASEAANAVVTPKGKNQEADKNSALELWYIEVNGDKFTIATANKKAAWQAPQTKQKNLVAYASKAQLTKTTEQVSLSGYTATAAEGSCIIQNTDKSACVHYTDNNLGSWTDANPASVMMFEFYNVPEANLTKENLASVTYTYTLDGAKNTKTITVDQTIGSNYNAPAVDFVTFTQPTGTVKEGANNVTVTCTEALPFEKTTDLNNPKWSTINMHNYNNYSYQLFWNYVADSQDIKATKQNYNYEILKDDAYLWCFYGNAFDGFEIYNKKATTSKSLNATDGNAQITEGAHTKWFIVNSGEDSGKPCFTSDHTNYLNAQFDKGSQTIATLKYWTSPDGGSTCRVFAPAHWVLTKAEDVINIPNNAVGGYLNDEFLDNQYTEYEKDLFNITNAIALGDAIKNLQSNGITIEAGAYYRLQNVQRKSALSANSTKAVPGKISNSDINGLWQFVAGEGENTYKLFNPNHKNNLPAPNKIGDGFNEGAEYTLNDLTDAQFNLKVGNNNLVDYGNGNIGSWSDNPKNSDGAWYLVKATDIEVDLASANDGAYATTYLPFGVSGVEGATAFIGKKNGDQLNMTSVNAFPAETGVVLKGEKDAEKAVLTIGEATAVEGNELQGTLLGKAYENELVLGISGGQIGFYHLNDGATIGANKAFLPAVAQGAQSFVLNFDGEATAIESVMGKTNTDAPVYDLSGRRVVKTVKGGLYIQNGKKFIVR